MIHADHVNLLRAGIAERGGVWADFGSGDGAFTLALRELVGAEGEIYSVEKDRARLEAQKQNFQHQFPDSTIHFLHADFTRPLDLPPLDGVIMANALHFFRDKESVLRQLHGYLKNRSRLILVEYNVDRGNPWVPFPISFQYFQPLAARVGFGETRLLNARPSNFLHEIYSALAISKEP